MRGGVDEGEIVRTVHFHYQTGMSHIAFAPVPKHKVARADVFLLHLAAHQDLVAGAASEADTEVVERVVHEPRAVEGAWARAARTVSASELGLGKGDDGVDQRTVGGDDGRGGLVPAFGAVLRLRGVAGKNCR